MVGNLNNLFIEISVETFKEKEIWKDRWCSGLGFPYHGKVFIKFLPWRIFWISNRIGNFGVIEVRKENSEAAAAAARGLIRKHASSREKSELFRAKQRGIKSIVRKWNGNFRFPASSPVISRPNYSLFTRPFRIREFLYVSVYAALVLCVCGTRLFIDGPGEF